MSVCDLFSFSGYSGFVLQSGFNRDGSEDVDPYQYALWTFQYTFCATASTIVSGKFCPCVFDLVYFNLLVYVYLYTCTCIRVLVYVYLYTFTCIRVLDTCTRNVCTLYLYLHTCPLYLCTISITCTSILVPVYLFIKLSDA